MARGLKHGEVRLCVLPAPDKPRPVVILTRDAALTFLNRATVAPITSTIRDIPTEVALGVEDGMKAPCAVNLDHLVTVPRKSLGRYLSQLSPARMAAICRALEFALGCSESASVRVSEARVKEIE